MSKENFLLLLLALIQFTHVVDFMIAMPMSPILIDEWGINSMQFNTAVASYSLLAFISSLIAAYFINSAQLKRTLLIAYGGFIIGTAMCGLSDGYYMYMINRSITGAFGGLIGALILAIVGKVVPNERRAKGVGLVMMGFAAAAALGVPIGYYLANKFSWQVPYLLLAGLSTIIFILIIVVVPDIGRITDKKLPFREVYLTPFTNKNQIYALLLTSMLILGQFTMIPTINQFFVKNLGFPKEQITYIYLIGGISSVVTSPLFGRWADKYGRLKIFTIMLVLSCIPIFVITNLTTGALGIILITTTTFFITIGGRMIPATTMMTSAADAEHRGSFMSISVAIRQLASALAPIIGGMVLLNTPDKQVINYDIVGYVAIAFSLLALVFARKVKIADEASK